MHNMDKKKKLRRTARAALIEEIQTLAGSEQPRGVPSRLTVATYKAAIRTLAALPEGLPEGLSRKHIKK